MYCVQIGTVNTSIALPGYVGSIKYVMACLQLFVDVAEQKSKGETENMSNADSLRFQNDSYMKFISELIDKKICNVQVINDDFNLVIWSYTDYGDDTEKQHDELCVSIVSYSVLTQPSYEVCLLTNNTDQALEQRVAEECAYTKDGRWHMSVVNDTGNSSCIKNPEYLVKVQFKWFGCKVNYFLAVVCVIACLYLGKKFYVDRYSKSKIMFVFCNAIWVVWRILETLHEDTLWKDKFSYMCLAMHFIQALSQTMSLYLLSGISLERLYAIVSPIRYRRNIKKRGYRICMLVVMALVVCAVCYTLNIVSVLTMQDDTVRQTCRLSVSDSSTEYLGFTVVAKVFTLVFVFLLPCIILIYCNVMMIIHIKKPEKTLGKHSVRGKSVKKLDKNLSILFLSSVFILCCLAKPILDIQMAARVHSKGNDAKRSVDEVITEVVFVNLEIIASAISTIVGVRFGA